MGELYQEIIQTMGGMQDHPCYFCGLSPVHYKVKDWLCPRCCLVVCDDCFGREEHYSCGRNYSDEDSRLFVWGINQ